MTTEELRELARVLVRLHVVGDDYRAACRASAILERLADGALADRESSVYEYHEEAVAHDAIASYRKAVMGEE